MTNISEVNNKSVIVDYYNHKKEALTPLIKCVAPCHVPEKPRQLLCFFYELVNTAGIKLRNINRNLTAKQEQIDDKEEFHKNFTYRASCLSDYIA